MTSLRDRHVPEMHQELSWKVPVRFATTAAATLATGFEAGDVHDGVTLVDGDYGLVKDQAAASQNGIYVVQASGAPVRRFDANTLAEMQGAAVAVLEGTVNGGSVWFVTNPDCDPAIADDIDFDELDGPFRRTTTAGLWRFRPSQRLIYDAQEKAYIQLDNGTAELDGENGSYFLARDGNTSVNSTDEVDIYANDGTAGGSADAKHRLIGGHGAVLPILSADPSGPNSEDGQVYYNDVTFKFRGRANGAWTDLN